MKNLLVILSMVIISASLFAQSGGDYIKTNQGTFFFKRIKTDVDNNFIGVKPNGERAKFNKEDVIAYVQKGNYFQKMPVYEDNVLTGEKGFMKLIETKKGMALLEYKHTNKTTGKKAIKYFVFKKDKFVLEMNDKNEGTLTSYFEGY